MVILPCGSGVWRNCPTSSDGVTWTTMTRFLSGRSNILYGVTYGNSTFVAVGEEGTIIQSDSSGTTSTTPTPTPTAIPTPLSQTT